jgi:hypothetical protein
LLICSGGLAEVMRYYGTALNDKLTGRFVMAARTVIDPLAAGRAFTTW